MRVFGKAKVNNAMFIYNCCSGSAKKPITFGSILLAEKVVMNENVNFNSFQFQEIRLRFKKMHFLRPF